MGPSTRSSGTPSWWSSEHPRISRTGPGEAVACAIEMQNVMGRVNERNRGKGLPELEMGIGLNETEVVVENIGSSKRIKYAVVGSGVNLTGRIESYSTGGQILVSESIRKKLGDALKIDGFREVLPKGAQNSITIYQVGGIAGGYNLALTRDKQQLVELARDIPITANLVGGKDVGP
jgi:adenylate cyclase